jgi:hypothetical protein
MAIAPWLCMMLAMRQLEPTLSMTECLNRLAGPAILFGTQALAMYGGLQLMTRTDEFSAFAADLRG